MTFREQPGPTRVTVNSSLNNDGADSTSPSSACQIVLEVVAGPHTGETYQVAHHQTLIVGRETTTQIPLSEDLYFSRHHFCLEINPPACIFRDLGSRNGTFVNGQQCSEKPLSNGDIISGGKTKLLVKIEHPEKKLSTASKFDDTIPPRQQSSDSLNTTTDDNSVPTIPGYDVHEEIGRGGMGVVHRATQKATGNLVALKIILPDQAVKEEDKKFFIREASILSQLDHPRIVRFHEFGLADGQLFLAMEFVPSIDFEHLLSTQSESSRIRIICGITCQVLEALEYAHSRSLIHRDIKPSNFLIHQPQRKLKVKLADFGLAKNYLNAGFSGMTLEGDIRGTLRYIPPELLSDSRFAKPYSDVYSLGVTLYELLCGQPPFDFAIAHQQIIAVLETAPPPLDEICPGIPSKLVAIVEKALAKDPLKRFSSAEQMRQSLLPFTKRTKP